MRKSCETARSRSALHPGPLALKAEHVLLFQHCGHGAGADGDGQHGGEGERIACEVKLKAMVGEGEDEVCAEHRRKARAMPQNSRP